MKNKKVIVTILVLLSVLRSSFEEQSVDDFRNETLKVHNELRKIHNAEPLKRNTDLDKKANELANLASTKTELGDLEAGENIFMACTTYNRAITGKEVSNAWYDEVCHPIFDFINTDNKQARSFTQIVWKGSKDIGVGRAVVKRNHQICTYVVVLYKPPGNIIGAFKDNVLKGKFDEKSYCHAMRKATENLKRVKLNKKSGFKKEQKNQETFSNDKKSEIMFTLNKKSENPEILRRTLYYKIPVRFITSTNTGSTIALPRKRKAKHTVTRGTRKSHHYSMEDSSEFQLPVTSSQVGTINPVVSPRLGTTDPVISSLLGTTTAGISPQSGMRHSSPVEESFDINDSYGGSHNDGELQTGDAADFKPYNVADAQPSGGDVQASYMKNELEKSASEEKITNAMSELLGRKKDVSQDINVPGITRGLDGDTKLAKDKELQIVVLGVTH